MSNINLRLFLAFFLVFVLTIIPLPTLLTGFRPPWVLMLILYLQFFLPNYFNITVLFILGLCLDVLLSTVIGEHAFALLIATWISSTKARRFYFYSIGQQMLMVAKYCLIYQLVIYFIDVFLNYNHNVIWVCGSSLVSLLLWPWLRLLADYLLWVKSPIYR